MPRQGARLLLTEHGHVITACRFTKNLTPAQVEINIIEAFDGKTPAGVDIDSHELGGTNVSTWSIRNRWCHS